MQDLKADLISLRIKYVEKSGKRYALCGFSWAGNEVDVEDTWGPAVAQVAYQRKKGRDASNVWQYREVTPASVIPPHLVGLLGREYLAAPEIKKIRPLEGTDCVAVDFSVELPIRVPEDCGPLGAAVGDAVSLSMAPAQGTLPL